MSNLTVYKQLTMSPSALFSVLKQEIGVKSTCMPFAAKAIEALQSLGNLTEPEALKAANTFLSDLQTLNQGGIVAEDYDKTDFVKRGKVITISARVEAFLRAAARKGYRITETIVAVPGDDANTTYFKENFYNGEIVYTLEDRRINPDRKITAQRLIEGYFSKFICRLEVTDIRHGKRLAMTVCEMANDEVLAISSASEQGVYKAKWETYKDNWGKERKRKVISDELNDPSVFWIRWTGEMVNKTVIRRALKRVREVLPELKETIYAFDRDEEEHQPAESEPTIDIPVETKNVDLLNLTEQQRADVAETLELYSVNPKLASDATEEIKSLLDGGAELQGVINSHYAAIHCIRKSKNLWPLIQPYFEVAHE